MATTEKITFSGSTPLCKKLVFFARKQRDILLEDMAHNKLTIGSRRINFDSGAVIVVTSTFGHQEIKISVPPFVAPEKLVHKVEAVTFLGDVVFESRVCRSDSTMPDVFSVHVEKNSAGTKAYKLYPRSDSLGGYCHWHGYPDEEDKGRFDIVSYSGPSPGYGLSGDDPTHMIWVSPAIYVNGVYHTVDIDLTGSAVLGGCIRIIDGTKYIVVIMSNKITNWTTTDYSLEENYESAVYYAKYDQNNTNIFPKNMYNAQTNPTGWIMAGKIELTRRLVDSINQSQNDNISVGMYHFNQSATCAVSNLGSTGTEICFQENSWGFEQKLLSLQPPMMYVTPKTPFSRPFKTITVSDEGGGPGEHTFETRLCHHPGGQCVAIGYRKDVLTGLYCADIDSTIWIDSTNGYPWQADATYWKDLFFYSITGEYLSVVKSTTNITSEVSSYSSTAKTLTQEFTPPLFNKQPDFVEPISSPRRYFKDGEDAFVPIHDWVQITGNYLGIHYIDIPNRACSFCLTEQSDAPVGGSSALFSIFDGPGRMGMFAFLDGEYKTSYIKYMHDVRAYYLRVSNSTQHSGTYDQSIYPSSTIRYRPAEQGFKTLSSWIPNARMSFAVVGDLMIGQLTPPAQISDDEHYEDWRVVEQLKGYQTVDETTGHGRYTGIRNRGGIYPKDLEEQFLATKADPDAGITVEDYDPETGTYPELHLAGNFDKFYDCWRHVFLTRLTKEVTTYYVDESGHILGV